MDEMNRNHTKSVIINGLGIGMIIIGFLCFVVGIVSIGLLGFIGGFILTLVASSFENQAKGMYKVKYLRPLLEKYFEITEFSPSKGLEKEVVYEADLFSSGNRYNSNDYVRGKYKNIPFTMADVTIKHVQKTGKTTTTTTRFKGKWIIADFPKSIKGYIKVREKEFLSGDGTGIFSGLEKIETESIEFNNKFGVRCTDEVEAFYILTPHFMETLLDIEKSMEGTIGFAFYNNKVHIGIFSHTDDFEIDWTESFDEDLLVKHEYEIKRIVRLLDSLYKNVNLFTEV